MGKKYALILIKDTMHILSEKSIRSCIEGSDYSEEEIVRHDITKWISIYHESPSDMVIELFQLSAKRAITERLSISFLNDLWIINDNTLTYETIQEAALLLSSRISLPIFFCTNFDDDIWITGVCHEGTVLTSHRICNYCDKLGSSPSEFDAQAYNNALSESDLNSVMHISVAKNIREAEQAFSSIFGYKL